MLNHRLQLRRYDFATLSGAEYLNDMIVNNYMVLIEERNKADPSLPQVFAYDTFLYTKIKLRGMAEAICAFGKKLRTEELIFFPIHNEEMLH